MAVTFVILVGDPTLYENFLGTLSAHLTASIPDELCNYFQIYGKERTRITSGQNPGLSLLSVLNEKGVITPLGVGALEKPFKQLEMVQAVAKIHEYQSLTSDEGERLLKSSAVMSYEGSTLISKIVSKSVGRSVGLSAMSVSMYPRRDERDYRIQTKIYTKCHILS